MSEPYPYPTKIHWYAGMAFHLDGRITYYTEKDLNAYTPLERREYLMDILMQVIGKKIDPNDLIDRLEEHMSEADRIEISQLAFEHDLITLDSEGDVIPMSSLTGGRAYTIRTPLPEATWERLPTAGTPMALTPGGHHAHYDYEVKSWPWFFEPMCAGKKKHDMRDKTERPYRVGDRMLLREFDPRGAGYTGREAIAMITYITSNDTPCAMSSNALDKSACILSVNVMELGDTDRNA